MLKLSLETHQQNTLLRRCYLRSLKAELLSENAPTAIPIAKVIRRLLELAPGAIPALRQAEVKTDGDKTRLVVNNFRGRPSETFTNSTSSQQERLEEVFQGNARLLTDGTDAEQSHFSVHSRFLRYNDVGEIVHELIPSSSGALRILEDQLTIYRLTEALPLELESIRLGFEQYRKRFFGSIVGSLPRIQGRFYLEISKERISLFAEEERRGKSKEMPMNEMGLLSALDRSLAETDMYTTFYHEIESSFGT